MIYKGPHTKVTFVYNESKEKVYFVIETKGDVNNLRPSEKAKIESAKKHFEIVKVNYKEVDSYNQFIQSV